MKQVFPSKTILCAFGGDGGDDHERFQICCIYVCL